MLPAGTAYGRTVALNATLGAALVAGLAGGGAAAAADQRGPASVVSFPWPTEFRTPAPTSLEMGSTGIEALRNRMVPVRPAPDSLPEVGPTLAGSAGAGTAGGLAPREVAPTTLGDSDLGPSRWQPRPAPTRPGVTAGLSAEAVRRKPRPVVGSAHAAWVHPNPSSVVTSCFGQRWGRQHQGVDLGLAHEEARGEAQRRGTDAVDDQAAVRHDAADVLAFVVRGNDNEPALVEG